MKFLQSLNLFIFIYASVLLGASDISDMSQAVQSNLLEPEWVLNSNMDDTQICGIGFSASQPTINIQKKIANITAKADIGKQIEIYVYAELNKKQECTSEQCTSEMSAISKHESAQMIKGACQTHEWINPNDNSYYVELCVPKIKI